LKRLPPAFQQVSRRSLLQGAAALLAAPTAARAAPAEALDIMAAPTGASILLARAFDAGALAGAAPGASFSVWRDADELRAGVVSGRTKLFSTPTHVPANLANRGMPVKLLAVIGMGHLFVVTADEAISSFHDLAGKPVLGFFKNDMPDLVFRACARMEGMDPDKDFQLSYVQGGMEAAQMLAAGKVSSAILSEPPSTAAIMMAGHEGRTLRRAISLQEVWGRHKGTVGIPMVGVAAHESLVRQSPELVVALRVGLAAAKDWALAHPGDAGALAEKTLQMRAPVFEKAIERFNMTVVSAKQAQAQLTGFYQTLLDLAPGALAGRLPDETFYLDF
jgi:NitT/TauT family transport system substrate-binding protein